MAWQSGKVACDGARGLGLLGLCGGSDGVVVGSGGLWWSGRRRGGSGVAGLGGKTGEVMNSAVFKTWGEEDGVLFDVFT
nr:hypothetical protein [Tanacetum cinerariifolium]